MSHDLQYDEDLRDLEKLLTTLVMEDDSLCDTSESAYYISVQNGLQQIFGSSVENGIKVPISQHILQLRNGYNLGQSTEISHTLFSSEKEPQDPPPAAPSLR